MQLPNKLYSYRDSTLALIPKILKRLQKQPIELNDLYREMKPELVDATDFMPAMDCLYALRAVDINDEGEVYICL